MGHINRMELLVTFYLTFTLFLFLLIHDTSALNAYEGAGH